ncbi:MAG TPA: hypothetical protein PJ990_16910 [Saprospiraceae bacterium]|nr:hypothetical protein [Saprospiraceae bacterium]
MDLQLIESVNQFKDDIFIMSGIPDNKKITILSNELKVIQEFKFEGLYFYRADLHICEENQIILISVTTTEQYSYLNTSYQGYSTHWFEIKLLNGIYTFKKLDTWIQSDITRIKSDKNPVTKTWSWLAFRELNYLQQKEKKGRSTFIFFTQSEDHNHIPKFNSALYKNKRLDHTFDFLIKDDRIYISYISFGVPDKTTVLISNFDGSSIQIEEYETPLKKFHHYESTKLIEFQGDVYAYFWTNCHERSKYYGFEMYKTQSLNNFNEKKMLTKVIDNSFVHEIIWYNNLFVSYKKDSWFTENKFIGMIDEDGNINELADMGNELPIFVTKNKNVICYDKINLKLIYSKKI